MKVTMFVVAIMFGSGLLTVPHGLGASNYIAHRAVGKVSLVERELLQAILSGGSPAQIRKLVEDLDINFMVNTFKYQKDDQEIFVSGTPLSIAASLGAEEIVDVLLDVDGIIVDALVMTGHPSRLQEWSKLVQIQTALGVAVDANHLGVVKLLVEKGGASVNIGKSTVLPDMQVGSIDQGYHQLSYSTELIDATELDNFEMVDYLLINGADPSLTTSYSNGAPLNIVAATGNVEIAKKLLEYGAYVDNWATGVEYVSGRIVSGGKGINGTPLGIAAFKGDAEMVDLLLNFKADPNYRMYGWGPMDSAILKENWEIVDKLIKAGGQILPIDAEGNPQTFDPAKERPSIIGSSPR